jgi:DNA gyrase subunit A
VLVRTRVDEISVIGRNTQGVKVIRLDAKEKVVGVDKIDGLVDSDELEESDEATLADNESTNTETNNSNEAE